MTRSLVPAGAEILAQEDGECIQVAPQPSCVTVFFALPGRSVQQRAAAVSDLARADGWAERDRSEGSGGAFLQYRRTGHTANVGLVRGPAASCGGRPLSECVGRVDSVSVIRIGE